MWYIGDSFKQTKFFYPIRGSYSTCMYVRTYLCSTNFHCKLLKISVSDNILIFHYNNMYHTFRKSFAGEKVMQFDSI